jgi:hypothetical protein
LHLLVERKLSPKGLTGYCSGLRFFYNETLGPRSQAACAIDDRLFGRAPSQRVGQS